MQIDQTLRDGVPIVALKGRLDSRAAELCAARLVPLAGDGRPALILDMAEVGYVGGAGLRVLIMLAARARACGAALSIAAPPQPLIQALALSGLGERLEGVLPAV
ncbi:STAS domain-containing protein [Phenylobacterium soli]|uniref:STAS domain-containing protein n=1 Tax=Phenylobacterium soli TaxID=2170551 RepID=A0A328AF82_9CAUL|nr:STAS domain-containing protein [Phenylobacterium soli]RAK53291.1 hypothetical protein DJ017_01480 [Phenylobacterium soli]